MSTRAQTLADLDTAGEVLDSAARRLAYYASTIRHRLAGEADLNPAARGALLELVDEFDAAQARYEGAYAAAYPEATA